MPSFDAYSQELQVLTIYKIGQTHVLKINMNLFKLIKDGFQYNWIPQKHHFKFLQN